MIGQNYIYEKDEDNAYFSVVGDDLAVAVLSDRKRHGECSMEKKLKEKPLFHWGMWHEETMTEWALMAERFFIHRLIVDGLSEP